jgi:hypothetical protein
MVAWLTTLRPSALRRRWRLSSALSDVNARAHRPRGGGAGNVPAFSVDLMTSVNLLIQRIPLKTG